mgnify:CR=1 FL=1
MQHPDEDQEFLPEAGLTRQIKECSSVKIEERKVKNEYILQIIQQSEEILLLKQEKDSLLQTLSQMQEELQMSEILRKKQHDDGIPET